MSKTRTTAGRGVSGHPKSPVGAVELSGADEPGAARTAADRQNATVTHSPVTSRLRDVGTSESDWLGPGSERFDGMPYSLRPLNSLRESLFGECGQHAQL
ncbi:hypothetical protein GCM10027262_53480 [Nocardia tengchongensis]